MKQTKFLAFLLGLSAVLFSCGKDKESPVVSITSPVVHKIFEFGSTIEVLGQFSDDKELAEYSLTVSDASGQALPDFSFSEEDALSGTIFSFRTEIKIPDTLASEAFYLNFMVKDAKGNSTKKLHMVHVN